MSTPRAWLLVADDEPTERAGFDLMLTDQRMPGVDGVELLRRARRLQPTIPVVLMTAYGSVSDAVAAMKEGATDYLTKPFEPEELLIVLDKVLRTRRLEDEVATLRGVLRDRFRLDALVGRSTAMQAVFSMVERIAGSDVPVLIRGESGTGKELLARAIHAASSRERGPFVAVNCAAVPEQLLESEFFGHERGAFTGAVRSHAGRFAEAEGGTLLLDEIGAMRVELQAKLLRVLQEREFERVGGRGTVKVNVRVLAATGENLEEAILRKAFREDLFYRLNVVPIRLPALRERDEDVPLLVDHFLAKTAARYGRDPVGIEPAALAKLGSYPWPGNVRELESCIERMVLLARAPRLTVDDLPPEVAAGPEGTGPEARIELPAEGLSLDLLERYLIEKALRRTGGVLGPAAQLLGISYKTLQYRIQKHGLGADGGDAA